MGRNTQATSTASTSVAPHSRGRSASQKRTVTESYGLSPTRASARVPKPTRKASEELLLQAAKKPLLKKARVAELNESASFDRADSQPTPSKSQSQKKTSQTSQLVRSSQNAAPSRPAFQPKKARRSLPSQDTLSHTVSAQHDTVDGPTWISSTEELSSDLSEDNEDTNEDNEDTNEQGNTMTPPDTQQRRDSHARQGKTNNQASLNKEREDEDELEPDVSREEATAFQPDNNARVNDVEEYLKKLQRKGGSSRSKNDVNREMQDLQINSEAGHFPGLSISTMELVTKSQSTGPKKRRPYEKTDYASLADGMEPRVKRLEDLTRICFLATLDPDTCCHLVNKVFPEYMERPSDAWVGRIALRRVRQNCTQWKSRTIAEMRLYIEKVFVSSTNGEELRDDIMNSQKLRMAFLDMFDIGDFKNVFRFTKRYIDLRRSTPLAQWWAETVFANVAAYTKMVMDVEADRSKPTSTQRKELTQNKLLGAFNNIGKQSTMAKFRPDFIDFFFDANATTRCKGNGDGDDAHNPDGDDLLGVVRPPPGVDANTLPKSMFDNWQYANNTGEVFSKKT
ncbi:hypothetical protein EJ02DRAFT_438964 [Clathrospora elynae]|uniref:Uncharacterized protein n=1 Tax=Clathrospora elynae TaxID=706981 RepID=A0A6A5S7D4_9PLEO|nr:hypothetical protein EJ02DRAFT_438964 [Clathrospora elynae]